MIGVQEPTKNGKWRVAGKAEPYRTVRRPSRNSPRYHYHRGFANSPRYHYHRGFANSPHYRYSIAASPQHSAESLWLSAATYYLFS